mmetsp:Transcript_33724/g.90318  ORF Transcript_33724/g.90318 Transcript_33724/m.90318 type:complete len:251 (-) Transcript_33724:116-868(-)
MAQQMAMMQGMMNPAMQMAMMQGMMPGMPPMMHPAMMGMMQQPAPPPAEKKRKKEKDGSSSSSDDSSSSDLGNVSGALGPAAAMAAMAAMWHPGAASSQMGMPPAGGDSVADFLSMSNVSAEAAQRMRQLAPHLQQVVLKRGPLHDARNPTAVLLARIRDAELGSHAGYPEPGARQEDARWRPLDEDRRPARRSAKAAIEAMISDFRLSPGCAWMMRSLPPDKQKLAAKIDPSGQADPSGYVAEQLRKIV